MLDINYKDNCDLENYNLFFETMFERHLIWYKRFILKDEKLTDDEIFQKYKFTNVYRELDRNTQWEINNLIKDDTLSLRELIWRIFIFRLINNTNTFNILNEKFGYKNGIMNIDEYDADMFYNFLEELKNNDIVAFTSAYLVYNGKKNMTRNEFFAKNLFVYIVNNIDNIINFLQTAKSSREILNYLENIEGIGPFNAYQIYIDLTYIDVFSNLHLFNFKKDDDINIGPGSYTGAKLLFPKITKRYTIDVFNYLKDIAPIELNKIAQRRNIKFPYVNFNKNNVEITDVCTITITEIEHWLCEFQKYYGVLHDTGKTRKKFVPHTEIIKKSYALF